MKNRYSAVWLLAALMSGLCSVASFGQETGDKWAKWTWGVGVRPAYNLYSLGDFEKAKETFLDLSDIGQYDPSVKSFGGSLSAQLSMFGVYALKENLDVGFSLGYWHLGGGTYEFKSSSTLLGKGLSAPSETKETYDVSAFGLPLELFAMTPFTFLGQSLMARFALGLIFMSAAIDYTNIYAYSDMSYTSKGSFKDSALGSNVSVGMEYRATKCLFLKFIMGFMCGKLDGFEGDMRWEGGSKQKSRLATWESDNAFTVGTTSKGDPCPDSKPFNLGLSGLYFMMGAQWYFPCFF